MKFKVSPESILSRNPEVSTRLEEHGAVIFNSASGGMQRLNPTGLAIWERMDNVRSLRQIVQEIAEEFETESLIEVQQDVEAFACQIVDEGWGIPGPIKAQISPPPFPLNGDSPREVDISITGKCNLRCPMCFYADEMSCLPDLPTEVWLKFFRRLDSLAVHNICLSGGEVFVRKDIFEILEFLANTRMRYSILSNGTLISEDVVSKLLKPNIRRKLKHIQISVDGSCPEVHDKIRSDGSFVKTDRALRLIKSAGINLGVRVTINKHNLLDLEDIFAYLFNEIGLAVVSTNSVVEIGEAKDGGNEVGLNPSERLSAMEKLHTLSTNAWPGRIQASAGPLYELKQFAAMEKGEPLSAKYNGHLSACGCYFNKLAVNHDGSVTPCNMLGKMELGNLQTTDISEIWNGSSLKELRHRSAKKLTEVEKCAECQFQTICNGGCPGTAYEKFGTVFMPNPDNCYRNFRDALNPDELNRLLELFEKK